jgi:hypothetical protein
MTLTRSVGGSAGTLLSEEAKSFIKGIAYISVGQGTLAMCDFIFGDLLSGFMKGIFAALGFYITYMEDGVVILPSFTVVSFVNGSIALLSTLERMSARATPMFSGLMPLYLNYIHLSQILHPILCFGGAYLGWQIIKELRRSGAFSSSGYATGEGQTSPPRPRILSTGISGSMGNGGFVPFNGRGHSLSEINQQSTTTS